MTAIARLWRDHRPALVAFVLAVAISLFFAGRFIAFTIYWSDPAHHEIRPEGWMTPGYLARSWDLPRETVAEALGATPQPGKPQTLADIAKERGQSLDEFLAEVAAMLAELQAAEGDGS
ncbi:hypothetical protein [Ostreiculturibacter nitratireducens]|uniref:hypothetical protein n=1 Tax=Ostreiculturibacter nitratireducens TaxID=3075226 RepID=UPI0031B647D2